MKKAPTKILSQNQRRYISNELSRHISFDLHTTSKFKSLLLAKYIVIHIRRRPITLDLNAFLKVYLLLKKGSISHLSEFYLSAHSANNFRNISVPSGYTVVLMAQRFKRLSVNFTSLFVYWNQE